MENNGVEAFFLGSNNNALTNVVSDNNNYYRTYLFQGTCS